MPHIVQTGQTRCYDGTGREIPCSGTGQDGATCRGIRWPQVRFQAQGQVVADLLTGLTWTRAVNIGGFPCTWPEAFAQIATLNEDRYGGYDDWRLPNRNELRSLVSYQAKQPVLPADHPFTNIFLGWYWSSTTAAINPAYAWAMHLEGARMFYGRKDQAYLYWPVRGPGNGHLPATGQTLCFDTDGERIPCTGTAQDGAMQHGSPWPASRFALKGDVVYDHLTGLVWAARADAAGETVSWEEAFEVVRHWSRLHQSPGIRWQLPTINELASLVDCNCHSPALSARHPFTDLQEGYWASTTSFFETGWAWVLYLGKGALGVGFKPDRTFSVWPVGLVGKEDMEKPRCGEEPQGSTRMRTIPGS
ncbi:MAG: DUF1566 domain-containing protein [Desulfobulbus sp.]